MSGSVNKAIIVGNLGADPEVKPCHRCGKRIVRPGRRSEAQWKRQKFCSRRCAALVRKASDHEIVAMYLNGHSCADISPVVGISATHVARIVRRHGATRSASERVRLSHARPEVKERLSAACRGRPCPSHVKKALSQRTGSANHNWRSGLTMCGKYLSFTGSPANGEHAGRLLHQVVAEWRVGRRLRDGEVVHHVDGNTLNNAPENLRVMEAGDHARLHAEERRTARRIA